MRLSEIKNILGNSATLFGNDAEFSNLSIDTRTLQPGDFFIAIKGENFDAHDFLDAARKAGASGALVERIISSADLPQITVPNVRAALGVLGAWQRSQFLETPLIAVTGTCGKTTVKEMLASILRGQGKTLANVKSFNSDIGVPLTLWKLHEQYDYAVLELGANHFGEIDYLTKLVRPQIAVITNAGPGHLEGFGDVSGVARAKAEIFSGLAADGSGVAVLNADDEYFNYWQATAEKSGHKVISFGFSEKADIRAENVDMDDFGKPSFSLHLPGSAYPKTTIALPLCGQHNIANALAAAAACYVQGVSIQAIKAGLESVQPVYMRLIIQPGINGSEIIDDTYNAIPTAVIAALEFLALQPKKKIFVFGEMRELGDFAAKWHEIIGKKARELGIDTMYTLGTFAKEAAAAFGNGARIFSSKDQLILALRQELSSDDAVLIKGSRGAKMEEVVDALLKK